MLTALRRKAEDDTAGNGSGAGFRLRAQALALAGWMAGNGGITAAGTLALDAALG